MDDDLKTFAQSLKRLRKCAGLSQAALAAATGLPQTTLSRWEQGVAEPGLAGLKTLAEYFGTSIDSLCGLATPPGDIRSGEWIVDIDLLDQIRSGYEHGDDEAWAVAIPDRFQIVTSKEYEKLRRGLHKKGED